LSELKCQVCFESFLPNEGISCCAVGSDPHFLCDECFTGHVKEESRTEAMDLLEQRGGNVFCPMRLYGCKGAPAFTDADVARHSTDEVFELYTLAKRKLVETKLAREIGAAEKARFEAELKRLEQMSADERAVEHERRHIEDMLNLKCPRCAMVFVDFSNCAALTCGQAGCGAAFCAWCQKDCGGDAHSHVAHCDAKPPGADTFYDTRGEFMVVQRQRQRVAIERYFQNEVKASMRARVAEAVRVVLTGAEMGDVCDRFAV
jgi:hypothetical protein